MRDIGYHGWLFPCSSVEVSEGCFHIKSIISAAAAEAPEGPGAMTAKIDFPSRASRAMLSLVDFHALCL